MGWRLRLGKGFRQCCALKLSQMSLGLKREKGHSEGGVFQKAINSQIAVSLGEVSPFLPACGGVCVSPRLSSSSSSLCLQIWLILLPRACLICVLTISLAFRSPALPQAFLSPHGAFFRRCFTNQTHPVSWVCSLFTVFHPNYSFFLSYFATISLITAD